MNNQNQQGQAKAQNGDNGNSGNNGSNKRRKTNSQKRQSKLAKTKFVKTKRAVVSEKALKLTEMLTEYSPISGTSSYSSIKAIYDLEKYLDPDVIKLLKLFLSAVNSFTEGHSLKGNQSINNFVEQMLKMKLRSIKAHASKTGSDWLTEVKQKELLDDFIKAKLILPEEEVAALETATDSKGEIGDAPSNLDEAKIEDVPLPENIDVSQENKDE